MNCIDRRLEIQKFARGAVLVAVCLLGAQAAWAGGEALPRATTVTPVILEIAGPLNAPEVEVSGMTWKGDTLVILPQDPTLFAGAGQLGFFVLHKNEILAAIDGTADGPLQPRQVTCRAVGLSRIVKGFDGLEAVGLMGDRCYLTVEAEDDTTMAGYLVCGQYDMVNNEVVMDMTHLTAIPMGLNIPNVAEEALVIDDGQVITISEANGRNVNPKPVAKAFNADIDFEVTLPMPNIEYRVTDATGVDKAKRFWVVNYYFPAEREKLDPAPDPELERFGDPNSFDPDACLERLLELRIVRTCVQGDFIERTATPPVILAPLPDNTCRNWEAIVRLDQRGFLVMTDQYPATLLAFVPYPLAP
jgi:hypothetical protein